MKIRTVKKVCGRCNKIVWVKPRVRRCKRMERNRWGTSGYLCYGFLAAVPVTPKLKPRQDATDKLAHAECKLRVNQTRLKRMHTIVKKWQRKVAYYTKAATTAGLPLRKPRKVVKAKPEPGAIRIIDVGD